MMMVVARKKATRSAPDELRLLRSDMQALGRRLSKELAASRQEVRRLGQRVRALERMLQQPTAAGTPAVDAPFASPASKSLFTFLGRPYTPATAGTWSPSARPKHPAAH